MSNQTIMQISMGVSTGGSLLEGYFSSQAAQAQAGLMETQADTIRIEAEAEADRYERQAKSFKAEQSVRFLKSGVRLTGSPLDILDETSRISSERISAIRASREAAALGFEGRATQLRGAGRAALIGGITRGITGFGTQFSKYKKLFPSADKSKTEKFVWPGERSAK